MPPLKVTSDYDPGLTQIYEEQAREHGMTLSQYLAQVQHEFPTVDHEFNKGDIAYKYKHGAPLVRPEELPDLPTHMRRVHKWYMAAAEEGRIALPVGVRDEHYFRGDEEINVEFEELFQLYNQDALDKSIISCYCL